MNAMLQSRALLARLSVSTWTARRYDRVVTNEINTAHSASADAGRYNKHLLGGTDTTLGKVIAAGGHARAVHLTQALPWTDEGWRLLPSANYFQYTDAMRAERAAFEQAVETFANDYAALREQAKTRLGTLYNEADYPDASIIRGRFAFATEFAPLPAAGDFRLALPASEVGALERSITERVEKALAEAQRDAWRRLYEIVEKIHTRVTDPQIDEDSPTGQAKRAAIRDALVTKGLETAALLERLNVADDDAFEEMRQVIVREVSTLDTEALRSDGALRVDVAQETDDILQAMAAFYSPTTEAT